MVLLPEERGMTLLELRQMAARQQHQIEAQQQLLVAKEQRLKFLKQQEARHHTLQEDTHTLLGLRGKVESQELKLRHLRALRGQVEQQKTNNGNLGTELESIRALFCEKEKELDLAATKVEELTHQLDEIRKNSRRKNHHHHHPVSSTTADLENLRRELSYRTQLSEQQNGYICQQRGKIVHRQQDIAILDKKIIELNKRLHRKRLLNEQFASQIHTVSLSLTLTKNESQSEEPEHSQDDLAANHTSDWGEFSLTKKDPKYQTLPYNTKFTLRDSLSSSTSSTEDESCSEEHGESAKGQCLVSPLPPLNSSSGVLRKVDETISGGDAQQGSEDCDVVAESGSSQKISENIDARSDPFPQTKHSESKCPQPAPKPPSKSGQPQTTPKGVKPVVPPKPALSVKPMLVHREIVPSFPSRRDPDTDDTTLGMALSFLKNKSSEKEKNDVRYSAARDTAQDPLLPKSRILTYFSKTLLQPEDPKTDSSVLPPKRKPASGQLPIKPKPLTIRKVPGIEPPKLKVQPVASLTPHRKTVESQQQAAFPFKAPKSAPVPESEGETSLENGHDSSSVSKAGTEEEEGGPNRVETNPGDTSEPASCESGDKQDVESESAAVDDEREDSTDQSDSDHHHRAGRTVHNLKKGNLKCEGGTLRGSRRVSFDPLALLLDAALEGELELVKKTSNEVMNPSAANDEGITALHNAICAGHFDVVKFLVEFGCDVNAQDSDGWTPLHCAASCNNLAMVKFLVERGACIFATTLSDQETAAEKCEEDEEGFDGCSEYLFSLQENLGIMNKGVVFAVYDYEGQNADELSFRTGDPLGVLRKSDNEENEWWWSRLNDQEGYVPRNLLGLYRRVVPEEKSL